GALPPADHDGARGARRGARRADHEGARLRGARPARRAPTRLGRRVMTEPALAPRPEAPDVGGGPLAGVRVIELGMLLAGPFTGRLLGDMGAEIVKIEPP